MNKLMPISQLTQTLVKIKENFSELFKDSLTISTISGFNPDDYYRLGSKMLTEYEDEYTKTVQKYIEERYKINLESFGSDLEYTNTIVSETREDLLVNTLTSYQPIMSSVKRNLMISNPEDLDMLKSILSVNEISSDQNSFTPQEHLESLINIPYSLWQGVKRNNLISYVPFRIRVTTTEEIENPDNQYYAIGTVSMIENRMIKA